MFSNASKNPTSRIFVLLLLLCALPAVGLENPFTPDDNLLLSSKAANSDPALHTEYSGLCTWNWTCGGTAGRMKWTPDGQSCWNDSIPDMPMVVILHGYGFAHSDYDYLQNHLARNGMLSVSIDVIAVPPGGIGHPSSTDHQNAADEAEDYLTSQCFENNFLNHFALAQPVDFHNTAIVGHSRGGETARYLADNFNGHPDFTTRAVVSMAPTRHTSETLYGHETSAYLVFGGTGDPDVPPGQVFDAYDLGGYNEYSTPSSWDFDKGMKLFLSGSHRGFTDNPEMFQTNQPSTAQGYVNAFLHAWLLNDWQFYNGYIRGNLVPGDWTSGVSTQFSTRVARRVVDNFQDLNLSPNSLGGNVSTSQMDIASAVDAATLSTTPHTARALRVRPAADYAWIRWDIPAGERDFSTYLQLSLRLGQLTGDGPVLARLWVRDDGSLTSVDLDAYGDIPEPRSFCLEGNGFGCTTIEDQGYMRTFRVPVSAFGSVDNVDRIYLQFIDNSAGKDFLIDNLEFAETWQIAF